jgi:dTMP kinase
MAAEGKFIVFEGLDGSGKSTQLHMYAQRLRDRGVDCMTTEEPCGSTGLAHVIANRAASGATPEELALLFAADRRAHLTLYIEPALAAGKVVLCDRYVLSSYAYQAPGETSRSDGRLARLVTAANDGVRCPDATVVLVLTAEAAVARVSRRGGVGTFDGAQLSAHRMRGLTYCHADVFPHVGRVVEVEAHHARTWVAEQVRLALDPIVFGGEVSP